MVFAELVLGLAGAIIAWARDWPLGEALRPDASTPLWVAAGLAPLIGLLQASMRLHWPPLVRLRQIVGQLVRATLGQAAPWELALVAGAAGLGEEILFRGALQPIAIAWWGVPAGIAVVSVVFGALHAATKTYFFVATAVGGYLGWLAWQTGNLLIAVLIHALYDWIALRMILAWPVEPPTEDDAAPEQSRQPE